MKIMEFSLAGILILAITTHAAEAALLGRLDDGNGNFLAYYDDMLGITLLTDANLAASMDFGVSGIGVGGFAGRMDVATADEWLLAMNNYNGTGYMGISTWRLPLTGPIDNIAYDTTGTIMNYDGTTDIGYNISASGTTYAGNTYSEMAYLYYNTLGNKGKIAVDGTDPQTGYKNRNWESFINVELHRYLSGSEYDADHIFGFSMGAGQQLLLLKDPGTSVTDTGFVWAVATGDIAALTVPVPLPAAIWLFATGLLSMAGVARRKRKAG